MKTPAPISLRIRNAEATKQARDLLRRLDEKDRQRRRVRFLAAKSLVSITELRRIAGPHWQKECEQLEFSLRKISERGV